MTIVQQMQRIVDRHFGSSETFILDSESKMWQFLHLCVCGKVEQESCTFDNLFTQWLMSRYKNG